MVDEFKFVLENEQKQYLALKKEFNKKIQEFQFEKLQLQLSLEKDLKECKIKNRKFSTYITIEKLVKMSKT